jgi:hypothetical protein
MPSIGMTYEDKEKRMRGREDVFKQRREVKEAMVNVKRGHGTRDGVCIRLSRIE